MAALERPVLVFDLDGTLTDTLPGTFRAFQDAVEPALGRRPTEAEILSRFGPADHRIVAEWVGPEAAPEAQNRLYAAYAREFSRVRAFPGIPELLRDLRREGRRLGLFTGRGRPSTDVLLAALGFEALFESTVTGEEVPRPKPAPDGLLAVLDAMGALPAEAVYVGDTVKDAEAAFAAGAEFLAAAWGSPEPGRLADLGPVLSSPGELRTALLGGA